MTQRPRLVFPVGCPLFGIARSSRCRMARAATGDRWLVVGIEDGLSHIETYRQVYAQLSIPAGFENILMVFAGGQVETPGISERVQI
jgi:hypothetical protein